MEGETVRIDKSRSDGHEQNSCFENKVNRLDKVLKKKKRITCSTLNNRNNEIGLNNCKNEMENTLRGGRWEVGVEVSRLRYLPDIQIDAR